MLTIFSTVFGFLAPFIPQVFKFFTDKADRAHELAMFELRLKQGAQDHLYKMEEINAHADIAEMQGLRAPQQSFGVQMLDAAKGNQFGPWALVPAFYLFTLLDWFSGMVRPAVTYGIVIFYMLVKYAQYQSFMAAGSLITWQVAVQQIWTENDWAVLTLVLSFWFGARTAKAVFGGNASTGRVGG